MLLRSQSPHLAWQLMLLSMWWSMSFVFHFKSRYLGFALDWKVMKMGPSQSPQWVWYKTGGNNQLCFFNKYSNASVGLISSIHNFPLLQRLPDLYNIVSLKKWWDVFSQNATKKNNSSIILIVFMWGNLNNNIKETPNVIFFLTCAQVLVFICMWLLCIAVKFSLLFAFKIPVTRASKFKCKL